MAAKGTDNVDPKEMMDACNQILTKGGGGDGGCGGDGGSDGDGSGGSNGGGGGGWNVVWL